MLLWNRTAAKVGDNVTIVGVAQYAHGEYQIRRHGDGRFYIYIIHPTEYAKTQSFHIHAPTQIIAEAIAEDLHWDNPNPFNL